MEDSFMVAGVFTHSHEAHLFKTKLESAGIQAFVEFEHSSGGGFLEVGGNSGICVKIKKIDFHKAKELVEGFQEENDEYIEHLRSSNIKVNGKEYEPWEGYCPNCDHDKIYMRHFSLLKSFLIILSLGLWFLLMTQHPRKLCTACGHQWKD